MTNRIDVLRLVTAAGLAVSLGGVTFAQTSTPVPTAPTQTESDLTTADDLLYDGDAADDDIETDANYAGDVDPTNNIPGFDASSDVNNGPPTLLDNAGAALTIGGIFIDGIDFTFTVINNAAGDDLDFNATAGQGDVTEILMTNFGTNTVEFETDLQFNDALTIIQIGDGDDDGDGLTLGGPNADDDDFVFSNANGNTFVFNVDAGEELQIDSDFIDPNGGTNVIHQFGGGTVTLTGNVAGTNITEYVLQTGGGTLALVNGDAFGDADTLFVADSDTTLNLVSVFNDESIGELSGVGPGNGQGSIVDLEDGNILTIEGTGSNRFAIYNGGFRDDDANASFFIYDPSTNAGPGDFSTLFLNGDSSTANANIGAAGAANNGLLSAADGDTFDLESGTLLVGNGNVFGDAEVEISQTATQSILGAALTNGEQPGMNVTFDNNPIDMNADLQIAGNADLFFTNSTFDLDDDLTLDVNEENVIFGITPDTTADADDDFNLNGQTLRVHGPGVFQLTNAQFNTAENGTILVEDDGKLLGDNYVPTLVIGIEGYHLPGGSIGTTLVGADADVDGTDSYTLNGGPIVGDATLITDLRSTTVSATGVFNNGQLGATGAAAEGDLVDVIDTADAAGEVDDPAGDAVIGAWSAIRPNLDETYLNFLDPGADVDYDNDGLIETLADPNGDGVDDATGVSGTVVLNGDRTTIIRTKTETTAANSGFVTTSDGAVIAETGVALPAGAPATTFDFNDGVDADGNLDIQELIVNVDSAEVGNQEAASAVRIDTVGSVPGVLATTGDDTFVDIDNLTTLDVNEDFFIENVLEYYAASSNTRPGQAIDLVAVRQVGSYTAATESERDDIATAIWTLNADASLERNAGALGTNRGLTPGATGFNEAALILFRTDQLAGTSTQTSAQVFDTAMEQVEDGLRALGGAYAIVSHVNERINLQQVDYYAARRSGNAVLAQAFQGATLADVAGNPDLLDAAMDAQDHSHSGHYLEKNPWGVYVRGFGIFEEQDDGDDITGYEADGGGVTVGVDYAFNKDVILGIYFTYNATDVDLEGGLGDIDIDTFRFGPYLTWSFGNFFVDIQTTFGFHEQESTRNSPLLGFTNDADYDAFDFTLYGGVGYDFKYNQFAVTPEFQVQYSHYDQDSFSESGVGGLDVDEVEADLVNIRLGATFSYTFERDGVIFVPEVSGGWDFDAGDQIDDVNGRFNAGTATFGVEADTGEESAGFVGAGFTAFFNETVSVFVRYDGQFSGDNDVNAVSGGVAFRF